MSLCSENDTTDREGSWKMTLFVGSWRSLGQRALSFITTRTVCIPHSHIPEGDPPASSREGLIAV